MCNFLEKTLTDPNVFWLAIEAIATVVAAIIIIGQLRRLREESIAHRFEGFRYAVELLSSSEFGDQAESFYKLLDHGDPFEFHNSMPPLVHWILRTLETIDRMIRDEYLDEEFFFRIEGRRLAHLAINIRMMEEGHDTPRFEDQIRLYPNGRNLLRRAEEWAERNNIEVRV
jgi:hypothetical protein